MENKLELKHLAPYLPYGLRLLAHNEELKLTGITPHCGDIKLSLLTINSGIEYWCYIEYAKPTLRPLSDLNEEITHNGKTFKPYVELLRASNFDVDNMHQQELNRFKWNTQDHIEIKSYYEMELIFEWHFDVFGLIKKGLAIDVKEVKIW
jgi:hypothetical protein